MAYFVWRADYSVGDERIDSEHQHLLELAELLRTALRSGRGRQVVDDAFQALAHHVAKHFEQEESLFEAPGHPGCDAHRAEHSLFREELLELQAEKRLGHRHVERELTNWVESRLVVHLLEEVHACASRGTRP